MNPNWYRRDFIRKLILGLSGAWSAARGATPAVTPRSDTGGVEATSRTTLPSSPSGRSADGRTGWDQPIRRSYDLVVVGGGMGGAPAAISAARNGLRVALVHERPMLGGNASSEVGLSPEPIVGYHPYSREGGIAEEWHTEDRERNHVQEARGWVNCHWDLVLYESVVREKNIELYLNTTMYKPILRDANHLAAITAIQLGTEKTFELSAPLFMDATGWGTLGFRAGADLRWGREARREYGEPEAPEQADEAVMGSSFHHRAVDTGKPAPFKLPDWAASFPTEEDLFQRDHQSPGGAYFWVELAGPYHPIYDGDKLTHELLRQGLGVFDHVKNRGKHGAANHGLEFVTFWPYRRAGRRILGDYVVTQQQVQDPQPLEDAVAFGCWGIDIHPSDSILARKKPPMTPKRADEHFDRLGSQVYQIPIRALYSRNIYNLLSAGRTISASHVGFASTRVLSTSATVGQAAGVVAAQCRKHEVTPRELVKNRAWVKECQQIILRQDGHIPGVINEDPGDLARHARIQASSTARLALPDAASNASMRFPLAQIFPVSADRIDAIELLLESQAVVDVEVRVGLRQAANVWDFRSHREIGEARAVVPAKQSAWIRFQLGARVEPGQLYCVQTSAHQGVFWRSSSGADLFPGLNAGDLPGKNLWRPMLGGRALVMRLTPESSPYGPENVARGTHRPDVGPNLWISDPAAGLPAWIELHWNSARAFNLVQVTFDTNFSRRLTRPLARYPECVKDYDLKVFAAGRWQTVTTVRDNYVRRRVHRFERTSSDRLRVEILASNGAPSARVYEVRVYDES